MINRYSLELWLVVGLYIVAIFSGLMIFHKFERLDSAIAYISTSLKSNTDTVDALERRIREGAAKH